MRPARVALRFLHFRIGREGHRGDTGPARRREGVRVVLPLERGELRAPRRRVVQLDVRRGPECSAGEDDRGVVAEAEGRELGAAPRRAARRGVGPPARLEVLAVPQDAHEPGDEHGEVADDEGDGGLGDGSVRGADQIGCGRADLDVGSDCLGVAIWAKLERRVDDADDGGDHTC